MTKILLLKKQIIVVLFVLSPFFSKAQCPISFDLLVIGLKNTDVMFNQNLSHKGYVYDSKEKTFFCGDSYLFRKYYEGGVVGLDYMMPNSSSEIQKIINGAKNYGMKLTDSNTNPSTGLPINIYEGGPGNLMMQISGNEIFFSITLYGRR